MSGLIHSVANLIFPKKCLGCGQRGGYLCGECLDQIPRAKPLDDLNALACLDYHDARVKKAIWLLKYRGITSLAPLFARLIYDRLLENLAEEQEMLPGRRRHWKMGPIRTRKKRIIAGLSCCLPPCLAICPSWKRWLPKAQM